MFRVTAAFAATSLLAATVMGGSEVRAAAPTGVGLSAAHQVHTGENALWQVAVAHHGKKHTKVASKKTAHVKKNANVNVKKNANVNVKKNANVNVKKNANVNVKKNTNVHVDKNVNVVVRHHDYGWHGTRWGAVAFGVTMGALITVAANTPPYPPDPSLCWTWSNSAHTQGYWYYCSGP